MRPERLGLPSFATTAFAGCAGVAARRKGLVGGHGRDDDRRLRPPCPARERSRGVRRHGGPTRPGGEGRRGPEDGRGHRRMLGLAAPLLPRPGRHQSADGVVPLSRPVIGRLRCGRSGGGSRGSAEHVLGGVAYQVGAASLAGGAGHSSDHGGGDAKSLAHHQVGGGGQLVGQGHFGHLQGVAERV